MSQQQRKSGVVCSPNRYSLLDIEQRELNEVLADFTSTLDDDEKEYCTDCKKHVSQNGLLCEICDRWFHANCQKISRTTINFLDKNAKSREQGNKVHWWCTHCGLGAERIIKTLGKIKRSQDALAQKIEQLELDEAEISELKSKTEEHQKWFDKNLPIINEDHARIVELTKKGGTKGISPKVPGDLLDRLKKCEDEMSLLKQNQANWPALGEQGAAALVPPVHANIQAKITRDVADRVERKNNIVIFGMKETESNLKSEVENHDKACVEELCQLTAEGNYPFKVKRLGKRIVLRDEEDSREGVIAGSSDGDSPKSKPKNRPLLVCFDKEDHKLAL